MLRAQNFLHLKNCSNTAKMSSVWQRCVSSGGKGLNIASRTKPAPLQRQQLMFYNVASLSSSNAAATTTTNNNSNREYSTTDGKLNENTKRKTSFVNSNATGGSYKNQRNNNNNGKHNNYGKQQHQQQHQHQHQQQRKRIGAHDEHTSSKAEQLDDESSSSPFTITADQTIPAPVLNNSHSDDSDPVDSQFEVLFDNIITQIKTQTKSQRQKEKWEEAKLIQERIKVRGSSQGGRRGGEGTRNPNRQQQHHSHQTHHKQSHAHHKQSHHHHQQQQQQHSENKEFNSLGFDVQQSLEMQSLFLNTPNSSSPSSSSTVVTTSTAAADGATTDTTNGNDYLNYEFDYEPQLNVSFGSSRSTHRDEEHNREVNRAAPPTSDIPSVAPVSLSDIISKGHSDVKGSRMNQQSKSGSFTSQKVTNMVQQRKSNDQFDSVQKEPPTVQRKKYEFGQRSRNAKLDHIFSKFTPSVSDNGGVIYRRNMSMLTDDVILQLLQYDGEKSGVQPNRKRFKKLELSDSAPVGIDTDDQPPIATLGHGLERTLQNPGVHVIYDRKAQTNNFTPFLRRIHQPEEIDFRAITPFITTSQDQQIHDLASKNQCRYKGSTSSLSGALVPLYLLLSNFRPTASRALPSFRDMTSVFTPATRKPNSIVLRPHSKESHIYSIDSWKPPIASSNKILMDLGKSLERMLTMEPNDFEQRFVKSRNGRGQMDEAEYEYEPEAYTYMKLGKIIARSQLDCAWQDEQRSKKLVFDIKTRAIMPIRINVQEYEKYSNHSIHSINGVSHSYEREFYDMVRSVFIKYSFQARIGRMDGMFVSFHNTKEMFGFEYIPLEEIDTYVFGSHYMGEQTLMHCMKLLEIVCDTITERHPGVALKTTFWVKKIDPYFVDIFVEPIPNDQGWTEEEENSWDSIKQNQNPFGLNNEVYCYRLGAEVYVNDKLATSYYNFTPDDKLDIFYNLQLRATNKTDPYLFTEYQDVIKRSVLLP